METYFLLTQLHFYKLFLVIQVICPGSQKAKSKKQKNSLWLSWDLLKQDSNKPGLTTFMG